MKAALALVALVAIAGPAAAACAPPIALDLSGPRPKVAIALAGGRTGIAVFDTGAMTSVAERRTAAALGLVDEGAPLPPFDRFAPPGSFRSTLRGLVVGGLAVGDVPVPVMPTPLPDVVAILGPSIFAGRVIELSLGDATLRVCDRNAATGALGAPTPYGDGPFNLPGVPIEIGGRAMTAHIDSGSPMQLAFPTRMAAELPLDGPLVPAGTARGHNGEAPVFTARLKGKVKVGPLTLDSPEVRFTDVLPAPNVGTALLKRLVVVIDPAARRSWVRAR